MVFNSLHFAFFFLVVLALDQVLHNRIRIRNCFLLLASYYFYGSWDWRFLSLIFTSTLLDYFFAIAIRRAQDRNGGENSARSKLFVTLSVVCNLGILGFFKYFNFFADSFCDLMNTIGWKCGPVFLEVVLPVGISFYTFQTLSYTIDVYRRELHPEKSLLNFSLFVSFFPQLVAGPIERAVHLVPQMRISNRVTKDDIHVGLYQIFSGLFKKVVIADNLATVVNATFKAGDPSGAEILLASYAFAFQIYCDFSGYSEIAIGSARLLGFDIRQNFNLPYFARNPSDFWQRWHISLSSWLRDYLYIPLGGNRRGHIRTYINLMATMVLGGLWHGAAWTFVIWGFYHGAILIVFRVLQPFSNKIHQRLKRWRPITNVINIAIFFHIILFSWIIFRAESVSQLGNFLNNLFSPNKFFYGNWEALRQHIIIVAPCLVIMVSMQVLQYRRNDHFVVLKLAPSIQGVIYGFALIAFIIFGDFGGSSFIYFQF